MMPEIAESWYKMHGMTRTGERNEVGVAEKGEVPVTPMAMAMIYHLSADQISTLASLVYLPKQGHMVQLLLPSKQDYVQEVIQLLHPQHQSRERTKVKKVKGLHHQLCLEGEKVCGNLGSVKGWKLVWPPQALSLPV